MNIVEVPEWILIRMENEKKVFLHYTENLDLIQETLTIDSKI